MKRKARNSRNVKWFRLCRRVRLEIFFSGFLTDGKSAVQILLAKLRSLLCKKHTIQ
jgi:hypothetical protein